jgi:hypothetical protein
VKIASGHEKKVIQRDMYPFLQQGMTKGGLSQTPLPTATGGGTNLFAFLRTSLWLASICIDDGYMCYFVGHIGRVAD